MNVTIRSHTPQDRQAIQCVHTAAFGQSLEADLVDALIDGDYAIVSLVAEQQAEVRGHVLLSRLEIVGGDTVTNSVALAPVAVAPDWQRRGIGSALIRRGLDACSALGETSVFVLGEPSYYRRFGFSAELARRFDSPYAGDAFQALELQTGALPASGNVLYAPPFQDL